MYRNSNFCGTYREGDDRPGGEVIVHIPLDARKNKDYWARKRISLYCE